MTILFEEEALVIEWSIVEARLAWFLFRFGSMVETQFVYVKIAFPVYESVKKMVLRKRGIVGGGLSFIVKSGYKMITRVTKTGYSFT